MKLLVLALVSVCVAVVVAAPKHKEGSPCKTDSDCKALACTPAQKAAGPAHCHAKKCGCGHAHAPKAKPSKRPPHPAMEAAAGPAGAAGAEERAAGEDRPAEQPAEGRDGGDANANPEGQEGNAPAEA